MILRKKQKSLENAKLYRDILLKAHSKRNTRLIRSTSTKKGQGVVFSWLKGVSDTHKHIAVYVKRLSFFKRFILFKKAHPSSLESGQLHQRVVFASHNPKQNRTQQWFQQARKENNFFGALLGMVMTFFSEKNCVPKKLSWRYTLSLTMILTIGISAYFFSVVQGAAYTFTQNDWSGGVSATVATHAANKTGWNKYVSATDIAAGADVELSLPSNYTFSDDGTISTTSPVAVAGGGFGSGTNSNTILSGSGATASIGITPVVTPVNKWDTALASVPGNVGDGAQMIRNGTDDDVYVLRGNISTGFYKYSILGDSWTILAVVPGTVANGAQMIRNGLDNDIYVLSGNGSTGFYKYSISGNSWTTLTVAPGAVERGSKIIRNGSDNDMYVMRGSISTGFYKYSISGNSWTTLTVVPGTVANGAQMIRNGSDNDIYVLPGNFTTSFYKYSISGNSWTALAVAPGGVEVGAQMIRYGSDNDMYLLAGSGSTGFYKYSISGNSWTTLTVAPGAVDLGAQMIRNGLDNDIYVVRGSSSTGFYKYSISGNSWTTLTVAPGAMYRGAQMIRSGASNDIYLMQGNSLNGFYKYSISSNSWINSAQSNLTATPVTVGTGGQMIRNGSDNDVYVLAGNNSTGFYKYSISGNSWTTLTVVPGGISDGASMIRNGTDNDIYVLRGNTSASFYKYSISGNSWTTLTVVPGLVRYGGQMIRYGSDNDIYVLQGNSTANFYKYSISGNSWTTLTVIPTTVGGGSQMIRNANDDSIYVMTGNITTNFYKYSISGNSWTTLTVAPGGMDLGSQMIRNGSDNDIYVVRGNNSTGFYKYSISGNSWTTLTVAPGAMYRGAQMIRSGASNDIYLMQGNSLSGFYKYSISGNSWTTMTSTPGLISDGASMIRNGSDGDVYVLQGNTSTGLYRFIITANAYTAPGTFTSAVIDLGAKANFSTLTNGSGTSLPTGASILYDIRAGNTSSPDGTWTGWTTGLVSGADTSAFVGDRYFQYRANLSTSVTTTTPSLASVTASYVQYPLIGTLISSPYDSSSAANVLGKVSWTASNTSSEETVRMQVRSSSDGITWGAWCGYADCSGSTYFTQSQNGSALSGSHPLQVGGDDRYFQYQTALASGGVATPVLNTVILQYIVNAAPEVQNVTASQGADGSVSIAYEARDIDTTSGSNSPGFVTPTFQYWNGSAWVDAATVVLGSANQSVNESTFTAHTATWNASADFSGQYFSNTVKIRVNANDNEGANNTASADSAVFIFDTKAPTGNIVTVDATTTPSTLHLTSSDDSALQVMYSLDSGFSSASWEAYATTKTIALATDPDTVYVKFKDAYSNTTSTLTVATPEMPINMMIQDTSNLLMTVPEYRLFVAWKTIANPTPGFANYEIYRATDAGAFSVVNTISSRLTNYYGDSTAPYNTTMRYQIASVDSSGNKSPLSSIVSGKADGIQGAGEGGGGTGGLDTTAPVISNVGSSSLGTTQATIAWDTDEASYSTVGFSISAGIFTQEMGVATLADTTAGLGRHSVTLTGLTPNTTYHYRIKSADNAGNIGIDDSGGNGYSFTTNPGPAITFGSLSGVGNTAAAISWTTSTTSTSSIHYSTSVVSGALVSPITIGPSATGTSHTQTIQGLSDNTVYYFSLHATDASNNTATDNNGGGFYSFTTTTDTTAPVISSIAAPLLTDDNALITWSTDEASTSQVKYSLTPGGPYTDTTATTTYDKSHAVVTSGLSTGTKYYFKVVSQDLSTNTATSTEENITTGLDPSMEHPALSEISDISDPPTFLTDQKAVITFKTDQSALCYIEYGTKAGDYNETPVSETLYNREHAIHLPGLILATPYFYQINCTDNTYHLVVSHEKNFTTLPKQVTSGSEAGDVTASGISNVSVSGVTGEGAIITWDTDEDASSFVRYGLTNVFGDMAGNDLINTDTTQYTTAHTVTLKNLIPGTKYFFTVLSTDASGNVGQSGENSFATKDVASLSSIRSFSQKIGEVTVAWKTSTKTTSSVEYGLTESYSEKKESNSSAFDHELTLSGLTTNTSYHFRVKGKDVLGNIFASSDLTFEPKSPPIISNVAVETLSEREAKVTFTSNVLTDALIVFQGVDVKEESGSQGDPTLTQSHSVILKNLTPGTKYRAVIKAQDEAGNASQNSEKTFETNKDDTAPNINQIRTDVALTQNNKVQALISWTTDELATSSIFYREGQYGEEKELIVSKDASQNHIGVITSFKPGSVYYLKVKVADIFGNKSLSKDYMALTPKRTENIVEIIVGNFKDIFSWAK